MLKLSNSFLKPLVLFCGGLLLCGQLMANTVPARLPVPSLAPMLKQVTPCIVSITGVKRIKAVPFPVLPGQSELPPMPQHGMPQVQEHISTTIGSGVVVDSDKGYIITNAHVINELEDINVTLSDQRNFNATLLGQDDASDLALLQIEASNLTAIEFADSDNLQVGDFVVAIGSPYGLKQTVTSGIISALSRNDFGIDGYYDFIQTDADINMGNSGGGLVNLNGQLIGINTVIYSPVNSGGSIGLGFAIPSNMVRGIYSQLASTGEVDRGPLGVRVQPLTPALAQAFKVKHASGAVINEVIPGTPADKADLKIGDILLTVNGKTIKDSIHLRTLISLVPAGKSVTLTLNRHGRELSTKTVLANPRDKFTAGASLFSGLKGAYLEATEATPMSPAGIRVVEIKKGTPARLSDLQEGDIITSAGTGQHPTPSVRALKSAIKGSQVLLLQITREKYSFFIAIKPTSAQKT